MVLFRCGVTTIYLFSVRSYTVEVLGMWNVWDGQGTAQLLHLFPLESAPPMTTLNPKRNAGLAFQLRKACYLPQSPQHIVRAFSNHNVYTGQCARKVDSLYIVCR